MSGNRTFEPVLPGDRLEARIEGVSTFRALIAPHASENNHSGAKNASA